MEKKLSFSVFKEKIIKTNELLAVVLEKNQSFDKAQKWIHHLKTRLELTKNEVSKLKLRNETLSSGLTTTERNYDSLKVEHEALKDKFNRLESDTGKTINNLQVNYQLTNQELEECKRKLSTLSASQEVKNATESKLSPVKRKRKSPVRKKKEKECIATNEKIAVLQADKEKLISEKCDLQLEVYELKKEISGLLHLQKSFENTDIEFANMKKELLELKNNYQNDVQNKDKEIERLSQEIKNVNKERDDLRRETAKLKISNSSLGEILTPEGNNEKGGKEVVQQVAELRNELKTKNEEIKRLSEEIKKMEIEKKKLQSESDKLSDENCSYQLEISMLQEDCRQNTAEKTNEDLISVTLPPTEENGNHTEENTALVNEESQTEARNEECRKNNTTPTNEEIIAIMKQMIVPSKVTPFENPNELDHQKWDNSRYDNRKESSPVNSDLQRIVKKRRFLRNKIRRKTRQVDLYGTLLALKKANINFIISSDGLLSSSRPPSHFNNMHLKSVKSKNSEKKKPKIIKTVTEELSCRLSCCKTAYMALKSKDEDSPLLGFVGVKNEICSQKENSNQDDNFHLVKQLEVERRTIDVQNDPREVENFIDMCDKTFNITEEKGESTEMSKQHNERDSRRKEVREAPTPVNASEDQCCQNEDRTPMAISDRQNCDVVELRRSKRKSNSLVSVIKKRRISVRNSLGITKCNSSKIGGEHVEENVSENITKLSQINSDEAIFKKPLPVAKDPKTTFKRPVCSIRRSNKVIEESKEENYANSCQKEEEEERQIDASISEIEREGEMEKEEVPLESPKSPTNENEPSFSEKPTVIPLEKVPESKVQRLPTTKIEVLFNKLMLYSAEEEALKEVVGEFIFQEPQYIAEAILERVALDCHDQADTKYSPAPLMTHAQRIMLGFMSKLEKSNVIGVFDSYLTLAERRLLTCKNFQEFEPITRLYLAVCKVNKNLSRMRKLCCDVFYFCGDFTVPFFFTVLTSWTEVLPLEPESKDFPVARVLVQIIYMKECNKPGYNLMPLRDLLIKYYGYPTERWDYNHFFKELLDKYLKNPCRSSDFALLLYCKNRPESWVYEQIEQHLKPLLDLKIQDNFKATLIILIGNLYNRFSSKSEANYLPKIREWFSSLANGETPDVVKRCVYLCLNRLKKK